MDGKEAPPKFTQPIKSLTPTEGDAATFEANVTGTPEPSIKWFRDNKELTSAHGYQISFAGGHCKLHVPKAKVSDTGKFKCVAQNPVGTAVSTAQLVVKEYAEAPEFTQQLESKNVTEGDSVRLDVRVKGVPAPSVVWFQNDEELESTMDVQIVHEGDQSSLIIPEVFDQDEGVYTVKAENSTGVASCQAQLVVKPIATSPPPPEKKDEPQVAPTQAAKVESKPPPQQPPPKTQPPAAPAQPPQQGPPAPKEKQPTEVKEKEVAAQQQRPEQSKAPPQKVVKEQQPVEKAPPPKAVEKPPPQESIPPPQKQQPVQNKPPPQQAQPAANPAAPKPVENVPPKTQPPPSAKPQAVEPAAKKAVENPAQTAPPANPAPVTKQAQKPVHNPAPTPNPPVPTPKADQKQSKPLFTKTIADSEVQEGSSITLECRVEGTPVPTVSWFREGVKIDPSLDFQIEYNAMNGKATLTIPEAFVDDAGKFTCTATNAAGSSSVSCHLRVKELPVPQTNAQQNELVPEHEEEGFVDPGPSLAPQFVRILQPQRYEEGMRAKFECRVSGKPAPTVVWLRHGVAVESGYRFLTRYDMMSGTAVFEITMLLPDDIGEYSCIAQNKVGQDSCSASLIPAGQYDHWMREKREAEAMSRARGQRDTINRELDTVFKKEGPVTPSQQRERGRASSAGSDEPVYYDPEEDGVIVSPFEKRLVQEVSHRQRIDKPVPPPPPEPEYKKSTFEARLESEIRSRSGRGPPIDAKNAAAFDVPSFEAQLLQSAPMPPASETETEMSEMDTDTERGGGGAPRFVKDLKNFRIPEGQSITLSARVDGSPRPKVKWFKEGRPLEQSTRYDLRFTEGMCSMHIAIVLPEDTGAFTCFAVSPKGKAVTTGRLLVTRTKGSGEEPQHMKGVMKHRVKSEGQQYSMPDHGVITGEVTEKHYRPSFKDVPSDTVVKEGKIARFNCRVRGRPPPDLVWYRNDTIVRNDANHRLVINEGGMHSLIITYCRPEDAGVYTCIAKNRAGEAKLRCTLTVEPKEQLEAPSFIDRIENVTVNQGEPIVLSCKVTGKPIPEVSWQKDGRHIIPGTGRYTMDHSLDGMCNMYIEISNRDDAAWYTCTAFNAAGRVACRAKVQVIATRRQQQEGPPLVISARRAPRTHASRAPTRTPQPRPSYVQEESYSDDESQPRRKASPPHFMVAVNSMRRTEGERAHFACRVEPAGDPTMKIEWMVNGKVISSGSRIMSNYEFGICTLDINGVYPEDSGVVTCRATNESGTIETSGKLVCGGRHSELSLDSVVSDSQLPEEMQSGIMAHIQREEEILRGDAPDLPAPVKSYPTPNFMIPLTDVKKKEGRDAHFVCKVEPADDPRLRVLWLRNGKPLVAGTRIQAKCEFGICSLDIRGVFAADSGTITCRVMNDSGTVDTHANLMVRGAEGVVSDSQLPQEMQTGIMAHIQREDEQQRGGDQDLSVPPKPYATPQFVVPLNNVTQKEGYNAHFACKVEPADDPRLRVQWLRNGKPLMEGTRIVSKCEFGICSLDIRGLYAEDSGTITCRVINDSGSVQSNCKLTCTGAGGVVSDSQLPQEMQTAIMAHIQREDEILRGDAPDLPTPAKSYPTPQFMIPLTDVKKKEGADAHFACKVEPADDPRLRVLWLRNGKPLVAGTRVQAKCEFGICSLDLKGLYAEDTGTITCRVMNDSGTVETHCKLVCTGRGTTITESQLPREMLAGLQSTLDYDEAMRSDTLPITHLGEREEADTYPPPKFIIGLNAVQISEGQDAHFACKVEPASDSNLEVEWLRNGKPISAGSKYVRKFEFGIVSMHIKGPYAEESGLISCRAKNRSGAHETQAKFICKGKSNIVSQSQLPQDMQAGIQRTLDMDDGMYGSGPTSQIHSEPYEDFHEPPMFVIELNNVKINEGHNSHFACRVEPAGDGSMRVEWFKDGRPILTGSRILTRFEFGVCVLDIKGTLPEDEGIITCKARNTMGEAATNARLVVKAKDAVIFESQLPSDMRAGIEKTLEYEEQLGLMRKEPEIYEEPPSKPEFITFPEPLCVVEGEPARFTARLSGHPVPRVLWFKDQDILADGRRMKIWFDGLYYLDIPKTRPYDSGTIRVIGRNRHGVVRAETQLEVLRRDDPHIQLKPTYKGVKTGVQPPDEPELKAAYDQKKGHYVTVPPEATQNALYPSDLSGGEGHPPAHHPPAHHAEPQKHTPIQPAQVQQQHAQPHLPGAPQQQQPGQRQPSQPQAPRQVPVQSPPQFLYKLEGTSAFPGEPARFSVRLSGMPAPEVAWYKDRQRLEPGLRVKMLEDEGVHTLLILEVQPEDEGVYHCEAKNTSGAINCGAQLRVGAEELSGHGQPPSAPVIHAPFTDVDVYEGTPVEFICHVNGNPEPTINWYLNDAIIKPSRYFMMVYQDGAARLLINEVFPEDEGMYKCEAVNSEGRVACTAKLTVAGTDSGEDL